MAISINKPEDINQLLKLAYAKLVFIYFSFSLSEVDLLCVL